MFKRLLQLLLVLLPGIALSQAMLAPDEATKAEQTMAEWLAHPMEFGVRPKRAKYLTTVRAKLPGKAPFTDVHVVEYEMPDGAYGRGFVNPVTWSFLGPLPYEALGNEKLVDVYAGWLWLFPAVQDGRALTQFRPSRLGELMAQLARNGITDVKVMEQYKVGTSEFYEFSGVRNGARIRGAGSAGSMLVFDASAPEASLPVVYTYLAKVIRGEI